MLQFRRNFETCCKHFLPRYFPVIGEHRVISEIWHFDIFFIDFTLKHADNYFTSYYTGQQFFKSIKCENNEKNPIKKGSIIIKIYKIFYTKLIIIFFALPYHIVRERKKIVFPRIHSRPRKLPYFLLSMIRYSEMRNFCLKFKIKKKKNFLLLIIAILEKVYQRNFAFNKTWQLCVSTRQKALCKLKLP